MNPQQFPNGPVQQAYSLPAFEGAMSSGIPTTQQLGQQVPTTRTQQAQPQQAPQTQPQQIQPQQAQPQLQQVPQFQQTQPQAQQVQPQQAPQTQPQQRQPQAQQAPDLTQPSPQQASLQHSQQYPGAFQSAQLTPQTQGLSQSQQPQQFEQTAQSWQPQLQQVPQPLSQVGQSLSGAEHFLPTGSASEVQQAPMGGGTQQAPVGGTQQSPTGGTGTATGMSQQTGVGQEQATQTGTAEIPLIDMFEADDKFVLLADLPGYDGEEIDLEASDQTLRITAVRQDVPEEDLRPVQRERRDRAERVVQLPRLFDVDGAEAICKDGVCRITLPKASEAGSHRIGVQ